MPQQSFRIGVSQIQLSTPTGTLLSSASGVGWTAAAITPTNITLNDVNSPLSTTSTYSVILAFVGQDTVNGGYTVTQSTSAVTGISVSTGQGILCSIPVANIPASTANTPAVAVFLKTGSGNYQLAEFAYINASQDFNHVIVSTPLYSVPSGFTAAVLQSATNTGNGILGSRAAGGWTFTALTPTTGGVTVDRTTSNVTVSPDTGGDFQVTTTRTAGIEFSLLPNDILQVIQGNAGNYVAYTATDGSIIQEGQMSIFTAVSVIPGNNPLIMTMPPDGQGYIENRLYLGQLLRNQQANTEAWTKTNTTPIKFRYDAAPIDTLVNSEHSEISFKLL